MKGETNQPAAAEETTAKTTEQWLDEVNAEAQARAAELTELIGATIQPIVFVIEEGVDAAVGFIKQPDAKQALKLIRSMGTDYETGIELAARAQLVREADVIQRGFEGTASDHRFMDANGKYAIEDSPLNLALLMRMQSTIKIFSDVFKKK